MVAFMKKIIGILCLGIFIFLSSIIIYEASLNGNASSSKSGFLTSLFDFGPKEAEIVPLDKITINNDSELYIGENESLNISFYPENASDKRIKVISSNQDVLSVSNNQLQPLKAGTSIITVISEENNQIKTEVTFEVKEKKVETLSLNLPDTLKEGNSYFLKASSNLGEISFTNLQFEFDEEYYSFNQDNHILTCLKSGLGKISLTYLLDSNIKFNKNYLIENQIYRQVNHFNLSLPNEIYVGDQLNGEFSFNDDATQKDYLCLLNGQLFYNELPIISNLQPYNLEVIPLGNMSLTKKYQINPLEVKAKEIIINTSTLTYGKNEKLSYTVVSQLANRAVTFSDVTFTSSDESILKIDENGNMIAFKKGQVTITVALKKDPSISQKGTITITSLDENIFNEMNHVIRKLVGHFGLFLITGLSGIAGLYLIFENKINKKIGIISAVIYGIYGLALAIISELVQLTANNRGPGINDVLIDYSGYLAGMLIFILIVFVCCFVKKKKSMKNKELNSL